jgi:hypothetical protein
MEFTELRQRCMHAAARSRRILEEALAHAERARELVAQCRNTRHTIMLQRAVAARFAQRRA